MARYRVGVDVGGTFTDGVAHDLESGKLIRVKVPTTPDDQSRGSIDLLGQFDFPASEIAAFNHGATVGVNAVLTRCGPRTGLLCTSGFRDLLDIGRLYRPDGDDLYDPSWIRPHQARPLVHRRHRREIYERLRDDGSVHEELDEEQAREELRFLREEGVESVAICMINAYASDLHERRLRDLVAEVLPDAYVQSSAIHPTAGEYKRTFAVVLDAYAGPAITFYLSRLRKRLAEAGFLGKVEMMQMSGGLRDLDATIGHFPALTMASGPVAGILGAEFYARNVVQERSLVCVDIGGTSTDIGLVRDGTALVTDDWEVDEGMPLGVASVDVTAVGAGGGSIVKVNEFGTLTVGPESAGARPGPAAYGHGGAEPTLTDCYVILGYLEPSLFLGGRMSVDPAAARQVIEPLAEQLEMSVEEVARAAYDLVNHDIANAIRSKVFDRALDVRDYSLLAYGGAGPMHATAIAQSLGMKSVIVPYFPGGFSAFGMLAGRPKVERIDARMRGLDELRPEELTGAFGELEEQVSSGLANQGIARDAIELERFIYVMYTGQSWDNRLPLAAGPIDDSTIEAIRRATDEHYEAVYGYRAPELGVFVTTLAVSGVGPAPEFELPRIERGGGEVSAQACEMLRSVSFGGEQDIDTPFLSRARLMAGNVVEGPAVIDDELGTIVIPPGAQLQVDDYATITIRW